MVFKIGFERENCRGCGACTTCDNWEIKNDGKATPKQTELKEIGCNQEAADICPAGIIKIKKM